MSVDMWDQENGSEGTVSNAIRRYTAQWGLPPTYDALLDRQSSLLERIKSLETERSDFLQWFDRHHVEHTVAKDNMTLKQMADHVYERTAEKVDRLELELERAKGDRNAEGVRQRSEYLPKLEQAHKALKLASEALNLERYRFIRSHAKDTDEFKTMQTPYDKVLAAIKACGVEL